MQRQPRELGVDPGNRRADHPAHRPLRALCAAGEGEKPKRSGLPKGTDAGDVDLDMALKLLSLPREVGLHPEDGKTITANFGRFGPYVAHDGIYASLEFAGRRVQHRPQPCRHLAGREESQGRAAAADREPLKELGADPDGTPIKVLKGRFGPYVTRWRDQCHHPEGTEPRSVTLEQALALIAERAAKGGGKKKKAKATARQESGQTEEDGRKTKALRKPRNPRRRPSRLTPPANMAQSALRSIRGTGCT